jgi:hypothetical protein
VRVTSTEQAEVLPFEAVRDAVQREWFAQHRAAALDEEYERLRATYSIQITPQTGAPR